MPAPQVGVRPGRPVATPKRQTEPLGLEIEADAGGDPYNRTGLHCLADLKKRAR
jgi:hypothetical protein